jgi:hypothetical protein
MLLQPGPMQPQRVRAITMVAVDGEHAAAVLKSLRGITEVMCDKHSEPVQEQNRINNPDFGRGSEGVGDLLKRRALQVPFDQSERLNTNGASNARRAGSHRPPFHSEY